MTEMIDILRKREGNPRRISRARLILVGKRNRLLAETPKPKQGPREKPKFRQNKAVMANDFLLKCAYKISQNKVFWPKQAVSDKTPKKEKTETPKQAEIFGRNRTETVSVCPLVDLQFTFSSQIPGYYHLK